MSIKPLEIHIHPILINERIIFATLLGTAALIAAGLAFMIDPITAARGTMVSAPLLSAVLAVAGYHLLLGIRARITPVARFNGPKPFSDPDSIAAGLLSNPMAAYRELRGLRRLLFGERVTYLTPLQRTVFMRYTSRLIPKALVISTAVLASALTILTPDLGTGTALGTTALAGALIAIATVEVLSAWSLIPKELPELSNDHHAEYYQAFGHPTHLYSRIPILADNLRRGPFPNRVAIARGDEVTGSVQDVGTFEGRITIERQPEISPTESKHQAQAMIRLSWCLLSLSCAVSAWPLFAGSPGPANWLTASAAGLLLIRGQALFRNGYRLLTALRFHSICIMIDLEGEMARADVTVGRGEHDSFGSANLSVRSNFTARFRCAALVSEAASLESPRVLLATHRGEETRQWIAIFREKIHELREGGVVPMGVDFEAMEVGRILQANHRSATNRHLMPGQAGRPPALPASTQSDDGEKTCPDCAETIKTRARKCRFCGFVFEVEVSS